MQKNVKWTFLICLAFLLCLTACSKEGNTPIGQTPEITNDLNEETPTPTSEGTGIKAVFTGEDIVAEASRTPIAVLINNLAPARPQSGLSQADVIWEVLAEGGITRLVAIFQSTSELEFDIGPVRSNRPYFIELAESYGATIAHAGASNDAYAILQRQKKSYLDEIYNAGSYFWRSKERKKPHNLYTNLSKLRQAVEDKAYPAELAVTGYSFADSEAISQGTIKNLQVMFQMKNYRVGYLYDEGTHTYKRSINNEPHIDKNNNEQLAASNLIFIQASHKVLDDEGRLSIDLASGGSAMLITNGNKVEGNWITAEDGMIRFLQDGQEMKLTPGKTIVHIIPEGKAITEHVNWE